MSDTVFTNLPIEEASLPTASDLEFEGLAATYARTLIIESVAGFTFLFIGGLIVNFFADDTGWLRGQWWFYGLYALIVLLICLLASVVARSRGFALREKDIHYKSGIVWKKTVSLPFNRIQHIEVESGPLERFFKLTTLKLFTAGGSSADMSIPALTFERSSTLRAYVADKAGVTETDHESEHHDSA